MGRATPLLALLFLPALACLSAEASERSQMAGLEHGIEESTTKTDRTWAHGTPQAPPPATASVSSESIAAWEASMGEQRAQPAPEPADSAPRLTVRVYGTPQGHPAPPGFVPIAAIVDPSDSKAPATSSSATHK